MQSCLPAGNYGACECAGDGGTAPVDAGLDAGVDGGMGADDGSVSGCSAPLVECAGSCVDVSTDEANCGGCGSDAANRCAAGSFCVGGTCQDVASCPTPFVVCAGNCVDPRVDPAWCGASGSCTGASAGMACGGVCSGGRCVFESCSDVLARGASTGDGLYLVDADGTGPLPPRDVYCDMTTSGGGWTLVYAIRNDVPDIAEPWWGMINLGSGDAFPSTPTPLPSGTHFLGPTRGVRNAYWYRNASLTSSVEMRATLLSSTGARLLDVRNLGTQLTRLIASGWSGVPTMECSVDNPYSLVISAAAVTGLAAGGTYSECYASPGGADFFRIVQGTIAAPILGDDSIGATNPMYAGSTTLFWVRSFTP